MLILGIDPGPIRSGWALYESKPQDVLDSGVCLNDELRFDLVERADWEDALFVIEEPRVFGKSGTYQSVLETAWQAGGFDAVWARRTRFGADRITRQKVLKCLGVKTRKGQDALVRRALIRLIGPTGTKAKPGPTYGVSSHAWQALAVAYTAAVLR